MIVSLFTNVPTDLAVKSITKRWHLISNNTNIPFEELLIAINMILDFTYFMLTTIFVKQIYGISMGSSLSDNTIANLVIQNIEILALNFLSF